MNDNNNKTRPVRKLTVDNFSVIKHAELEFGKITVLIGPQASGKSLLCKLAYFFQRVVIEQAELSIRGAEGFVGFRNRVTDEFFTWFPPLGLERNAEVLFLNGSYWVSLSRNHAPGIYDPDLGQVGAGGGSVGVEFSPEVRLRFEDIQKRIEAERAEHGRVEVENYVHEIRDVLLGLQSRTPDSYMYIPSSRSLFVTPQKAALAISQRGDPIDLRFSQDFSFDYSVRIPRHGLAHDLSKWIDRESRRILRGEIEVRAGRAVFLAEGDREIPLSLLSSGTLELLPLVTCLREFVGASSAVSQLLDLSQALHMRLFFLEEPEMSVFPSTQYDLVRIFARIANEPILDAHWVITTHSPYILSAFDNLIKAGLVGDISGDHREAVSKILDQKYWIRPEDFRAYALKPVEADPGKFETESIYDEKTGLIDGDYLDDVSSKISDEFGQLLEIQYGK